MFTQFDDPHVMLPAGQAGSQKPFEQTAQADPSPTVPPESLGGLAASVASPASCGGGALESSVGTVASAAGGMVASVEVGAPASSLPAGRLVVVVPSATKPSLKCVTCAVSVLPETVLGRMLKFVEFRSVHANAGVLPSLV